MKDFDESRQQLKAKGWRRSDRTGPDGVHEERWYAPPKRGGSFQTQQPVSYPTAVRVAGITPGPYARRCQPKPPYRRKKLWQLKHLDTKVVLNFIAEFQKRTDRWCLHYDLDEGLPGWTDFPQPLRMAKMRKLLAEELVTGCGCGCRGNFELTVKGLAYINRDRKRDTIRPGFDAKVNGRAVRDLWWEDDFTTMCAQFDDTGEVSKFFGCRLVSLTPGKVEGDAMTVEAVLQPTPIEYIPITFVMGGDWPKPDGT